MGRVINTNSPGKRRNASMRTIAELFRRLGQKQGVIDEDVRNMTAMIVLSLHEIDKTIIESITAWEKRGYWKKADDFQQKWWWVSTIAPPLEKMIRNETWDELPDMMMKLFPNVSSIQVNKYTRSETLWENAYETLMAKTPSQ